MIFTCIGFNFTKTTKEKQKVILQLIHKIYRVGPHGEITHAVNLLIVGTH